MWKVCFGMVWIVELEFLGVVICVRECGIFCSFMLEFVRNLSVGYFVVSMVLFLFILDYLIGWNELGLYYCYSNLFDKFYD